MDVEIKGSSSQMDIFWFILTSSTIQQLFSGTFRDSMLKCVGDG